MQIVDLSSLEESTKQFARDLSEMHFAEPTAYIYNPLIYAWTSHITYLKRFAQPKKKVVFLGMNPGPWGMAQNGIPFGEVNLVRDWIGIDEEVDRPFPEHPKRPIEGFSCQKSEVSGRRLWGLFQEKFSSAEHFFEDHFVINYCPLVFMEESGRNRTPDKLPASESEPLFSRCDEYLRNIIDYLSPEWIVGVGAFAEKQAQTSLQGMDVSIGKILHPSPASPAANKGWAEKATSQLVSQKIWS